MEQFHNTMDMLDLIILPAFCVQDGTIIRTNSAAAALLIEPGTPVQPMLSIGGEEYASFQGGCLYLTLSISGQPVNASVTRMQGFDVFCIGQEEDARLQVLSLAARQLREPLSGLMTIADKVFPDMAAGDEGLQEQLQYMNRSLFQMLRIINNMSDARAFAVGRESRKEVRDICGVLDEIFQKAILLAEPTGVALRYAGPSESIYMPIDSQKLERMIFNIISNALKFTPSGGTVDAKLTRCDRKLYLSIEDSGSGISKAVQSTLFSRYQREAGLEDSRHGLGLGMLLIHSTATLHGGTVLVEQPEGSGTRVTVSLPICQCSTQVHCHRMRVDYSGERDHGLTELSDVLPGSLFGSVL